MRQVHHESDTNNTNGQVQQRMTCNRYLNVFILYLIGLIVRLSCREINGLGTKFKVRSLNALYNKRSKVVIFRDS